MARPRSRAATSAAALLREVIEEAGQGWSPGVTLFTGDDPFHLDRALAALLDALAPGRGSDLSLTVYGEQRVEAAVLAAACRAVGMFSPRRVVWVRDINLIEGDPEPLVELAAAPPPNSFLLIRAVELDRRRKLPQALLAAGRVLEFQAARDAGSATVVREVVRIAREHSLEIEPAAAALLAEVSSGDFYRVDGELAKIRSWIGAGAPAVVGVSHIRELVSGSGLMSGWEVADALLQQDHGGALAALDRLLAAGEEPLRVLGGLAFRSRGMLQAKCLIERGVSPEKAAAAARLWGASPQRIASLLSRYSISDLLRFPSVLLAADRTLKSRAIPPRAVLESAIASLIPRNAAMRGTP